MVGVSFEGVSKSFGAPTAPIVALDSISAKADAGEFIHIVGHNGSGKTTLLKTLSGHLMPDAGSLYIEQHSDNGKFKRTEITSWPIHRRAEFIGMVRQQPAAGTFADLAVWENLRIASRPNARLQIASPSSLPEDTRKRLNEAGLGERLGQLAGALSGGQRQLLALEMVALQHPSILLLDEHTASLDRKNSRMCMELAVALAKGLGITVLNVTHNLYDVLEYGDRIWVMVDGRIAHIIDRCQKHGLTMVELVSLSHLAPETSL